MNKEEPTPIANDPTIVDDTIEVGEATLATVTMTAVLKGEMPRIGIGWQKKIIATNKRIDELAKGFVNDELPGKFKINRPFSYTKLLERFTKPLSESEVAAIMKKFPSDASDTALSFLSVLQGAYTKLADEVPVSTYETYLGPKNILPTSEKLFDFWAMQYWIVDDPFVIFKLMQCGALTPVQVETLKEFYPSLYNYMIVSTLDALVSRSLREPSFKSLPPRADRGLATLKQQRVVEYGINVHVAPPTQPKTSEVPPPKINKGLQTPGQAADAM